MKFITSMIDRIRATSLHSDGLVAIPREIALDWQLNRQAKRAPLTNSLAPEAYQYLRPENPRLEDISSRNRLIDPRVTRTKVWHDRHVAPDDMLYFRGDNAYVWQLRGRNNNEMGYALSAYYAEAISSLNLMKQLDEDGSFGAITFEIHKKLISRDLIDSVLEIEFLERTLAISKRSNIRVLDIGAGYGRLADRMCSALPNVGKYTCTDAIAVSTFVCEYYVAHRGRQNLIEVVPLYDAEKTILSQKVDIAINIHSFSECTSDAIEWWLSLLNRASVKYLMLVPNANINNRMGECLISNDLVDMSRCLAKYGYRSLHREPKYRDPLVQRYGLNPTFYHLFEYR